ncbi:hypothetical protein P5673_004925 [Acropora cervicornis]|uniref:Uncharacterized protein n=1 Tax=Acropora cervicornis TaxID=6130 RepID=A0AAD9QZ37_ACRCE|nr:hypothetical protein P5673_004925 [Acropora cervicornis]
MDCFYQGSRLRESAYYNSPPLIYGYGMPTYCSRQFFSPISRNSEIHTSRGNTGSRGASPSSQNVPNLMTISESNSSPASTASHTPPESPTDCTTETHQSTSKEASEDSGNSVKDTSESEEKTDGEDDKDVPWHYKQPFKHRRRENSSMKEQFTALDYESQNDALGENVRQKSNNMAPDKGKS